jgi:hypothetical protein
MFKNKLFFWHLVIHPITKYFRAKRGKIFLEHFPDIRKMKICDIGGSQHFWEKTQLDISYKNITIFNVSEDETQGTKGSHDSECEIVIYDGQKLPVDDHTFDLVVMNSVLEHVESGMRQSLIQEMKRVGKAIICQTPAFEFPIEPHFLFPFIHWLPKVLGYYLVHISPWRLLSNPKRTLINGYWYKTNLLKENELVDLFPWTKIEIEKFWGFKKSFVAIYRSD